MKKTSIFVEVNQTHIRNGQRSNRCNCPISLAIKEQYGYPYVSTGVDTTYYEDSYGNKGMFTLPTEAKEFVKNFDFGRRVSPLIFTATI